MQSQPPCMGGGNSNSKFSMNTIQESHRLHELYLAFRETPIFQAFNTRQITNHYAPNTVQLICFIFSPDLLISCSPVHLFTCSHGLDGTAAAPLHKQVHVIRLKNFRSAEFPNVWKQPTNFFSNLGGPRTSNSSPSSADITPFDFWQSNYKSNPNGQSNFCCHSTATYGKLSRFPSLNLRRLTLF